MSQFQTTKGIFCISLDFEKFWGVHDVCNLADVHQRFLKIDEVVDEMLILFRRYDIHATWAFVGLLAVEDRSELMRVMNGRHISYRIEDYNPYDLTRAKFDQVPMELLSAMPQLRKIARTANQELASHTFSHYYTLEQGQTSEEFEQDLIAMNAVANKLGTTFRSIVFPRNQVNEAYLKLLQQHGYVAFRGNQLNADWENVTYGNETKLQKVRRVADAYWPVSKTSSFSLKDLDQTNGLMNIPASRFLRPCKRNTFLEYLKLNRIKNEMTQAANNGAVYHLWWHPHNLTFHPKEALDQLEAILKHYDLLSRTKNFKSLNIGEIADHATT